MFRCGIFLLMASLWISSLYVFRGTEPGQNAGMSGARAQLIREPAAASSVVEPVAHKQDRLEPLTVDPL